MAAVELRVAGLDRQPSSARHRVPSVDRQVQQDLLDLTRISQDMPEVRSRREGQLDVLADQPGEHPSQVADDLVQVEHPGLQDLPAREGQQLLRQCGRPLASLQDLLHVLAPGVSLRQLG